jgi:hypothetical protein
MKKLLITLTLGLLMVGCGHSGNQGGTDTNAAIGTNIGGMTNMPSPGH